ncbi:MAG: molybdate ABC transporter substrate-binding protein [Limnothrix sp. RL_2_0]|nr:molybdate ABC transporter substrate-binding protein [Limnothrix sp. RL_2_0]
MIIKYWRLVLISLAIAFGLIACFSPPQKQVCIVAIAASLGDVMGEIQTEFEAIYPEMDIQANIAASGTLQRQIEQQAPLDVFASAALEPVENLVKQNLIQASAVRIFASNQLVLIQAADSLIKLNSLQDLAQSSIKKIAIGNPKTVPAGQYAVNALGRSPDLFNALQQSNKLVFGENVRQVLTYVLNRDVDAGFVYQTDILNQADVRVVEALETRLTGDIAYAIAPLRNAKNPEIAATFIEFVTSKKGQATLKKYGFAPPRD